MKIKRKIILSLLALFVFFTSATLISIVYIENTTEELMRLIKLHQIENLRRDLVMSVQTVQSDLYTVNTPLGHNLDSIVDNVSMLDESAERCLGCHHRESIRKQLENVRSLVSDYKLALSYYITASANKERINNIKSDAARKGEELLRQTENMSSSASATLGNLTSKAMTNITYARIVIVIILVSSLLLGVIVSANLTRSIARPIGDLVDATKRITSGAIGYTLTHTDQTEFGELARNFNAMSMTLKEDYDRLAAANRELRHLIAERDRVEEQLRQAHKMEAIGTLAGGIAHDFNNILMTMINHTELALNAMDKDAPAFQHLEKVLIGENRARDLIRQIILFSRQSGQERMPVQLHALVDELMTLLRASLPSNIEIQQKINTSAGTVMADPTQMHQVLMNLCANRAAYTRGVSRQGCQQRRQDRSQPTDERDPCATHEVSGDHPALAHRDHDCGARHRPRQTQGTLG